MGGGVFGVAAVLVTDGVIGISVTATFKHKYEYV